MFPAGAASEFDYRTAGGQRRPPPNAAGGLYASRHFGGGPIPEYRRGRKVNKKQRRGRKQLQRRAAPVSQRYGGRQRPAIPRDDFSDEFGGEEDFMQPAVMPYQPLPVRRPAVMPVPPPLPVGPQFGDEGGEDIDVGGQIRDVVPMTTAYMPSAKVPLAEDPSDSTYYSGTDPSRYYHPGVGHGVPYTEPTNIVDEGEGEGEGKQAPARDQGTDPSSYYHDPAAAFKATDVQQYDAEDEDIDKYDSVLAKKQEQEAADRRAAAKAAKDAAAKAASDAQAAKDAAAAAQQTTTTEPPPPPPPMASPFAGGFDPNAMPTTAAQFTQAGNPAAAAMLGRINQAPVIEDYTTQSVAEGGVIEESAGEDVIPNQILEAVSEAVMNGDEETIMAFKEAVVPDIFSMQEFDQLMDRIESDVMSGQQGPPAGPPAGPSVGPPVGPAMQVGGLIPGNGDAMADDIVTTADEGMPGAQKIAISSGEYVVAGDVVSGLGSGNTDAGAEVLDQLQEDVRIDRTGTPQQPPPINLSEVLPATYGDRYA